ncbi:MAG TPA: cation-translocating P-type ATPase [Anaerolineaceae bacterium]|nr:cation-translocating P-type ATPase [Anaerolineaceae bacterium]
MEKTVEFEIHSLLPGVEAEEDTCFERLAQELKQQKRMQLAHIERGDGMVKLCLHYEPETISLDEVQRLAERAGLAISHRYHHDLISIDGMDCSDCALVIEHSLQRMEGVLEVRLNYAGKRLWIEYDHQLISRRAIEQRIRSLGYEVALTPHRRWLRESRELLFSLAAGVLLLLGWLGSQFLGLSYFASTALYLGAYTIGGWDVARHGLLALRQRHFDTDLLMILAALGAAALGHFSEGALLIFLFSLGHALEERALGRARSAIDALASLVPKTALVRRDGSEAEAPVEDLRLKDIVILRPGTRIPVDGLVLSGCSGVDQSPVTGESIPVEKGPGEKVFAGTINGEGALEIQVTRLAQDSTLSRVMKMVEKAQTQKSPTYQAMERFERVYVPAVLIGTTLVMAILPLFGIPFQISFLRAMTLLVAASPCALALGAPAVTLSGIAQAARNGVLIKGGAYLEALGQLKAMAFDKTGTITYGKPEVTHLISLSPATWDEEKIMGLAAGLESRSGHPLAQAVVRAAVQRGIAPIAVEQVESLTGLGVRARADGHNLVIGNPALIEQAGVAVRAEAAQQIQALEDAAVTVILVGVDGEVAGLIGLADILRPEVKPMLYRLKQLGIQKTVLLSGDHQRVAAVIAAQAGLDDVFAGLMPENKSEAVETLTRQYGAVGMVGDGINDAPALAQATVGIAMGGASTDVALETADVALMGDNLERLPFAIGLGRATRWIIVENLTIALGVIFGLILASLTGWVGIGLAVLLHEGSTIVVVLNALRLLGYRGE